MLTGFISELRERGLHADVRTVLQIYTLMDRGLIRDIGGLYSYGERLVVKEPRQKGPYTIAFFAYFLDIHIAPGQSLDAAVMHSDAFSAWRRKYAPERVPSPQLVNEFLDFLFNKAPDLDKLIGARDRAAPFDADVPFSSIPATDDEPTVDYSAEDLAEIIKMMKAIAKEQKEPHNGGAKYIGMGGTTPYGNTGRSSAGVRSGGRGAHHSARLVLNDVRFFPLDMNARLSDSNIDAALMALKGVAEHREHLMLDVEETVRLGAKQGGLILPRLKREEADEFSIMVFIDNGGFSMDPHVPKVRALFQKMKTRFGHDLQIFYFHNIIGSTVFKDQARKREPVALETLLQSGAHHSVFIVGDASMAPYELHGAAIGKSGFENICDLAARFPRIVWLNPVSSGAWGLTETIGDIRSAIRMFPLTPKGIEQAVLHMNQFSVRKTEWNPARI